jgi:uncharacterized damage-inducible protein DinB
MNAISLLQRLHQHRAWTNANLLAAAAELSDEKLHAQFEIGQGSIWKSLVHLHGAEFVWLETLLGNEQAVLPGDLPDKIPGNQQGEGRIAGLDELRQKWTALEARWGAYLAALTPESLDEVVYRARKSAGKADRFAARRGDALLHICTHGQYTTAQIMNMLRRCGVEKLPDVMLMSMARKETP